MTQKELYTSPEVAVLTLQSEGVVPHETGFTEHRVQLRRPLRPIKLVCVCHHILKSFYLLQIFITEQPYEEVQQAEEKQDDAGHPRHHPDPCVMARDL